MTLPAPVSINGHPNRHIDQRTSEFNGYSINGHSNSTDLRSQWSQNDPNRWVSQKCLLSILSHARRESPPRGPTYLGQGAWVLHTWHGVQTPTNHLRHVGAVGLVELTVGEDYLPLHEMSTDSKRTTCLPPHMVCEVHHTKSGYEQLESRSSPCRPTRSSTSPKRMRYDLFRPQFEAESPSGRSARSAFCRTSRSQMGFSQHVPSSLEASKWLGDRRRGCPRYFGR